MEMSNDELITTADTVVDFKKTGDISYEKIKRNRDCHIPLQCQMYYVQPI